MASLVLLSVIFSNLRVCLWELFLFNQSSVGMFGKQRRKCTTVRGQDKYKYKRKHLKFSSIYYIGIYNDTTLPNLYFQDTGPPTMFHSLKRSTTRVAIRSL